MEKSIEQIVAETDRDAYLSSDDNADLKQKMAVMADRIRLSVESVEMLLNALELGEGETVLEVGTGFGYMTAILSQLCKHVHTIEKDPERADRSERLFKLQGIGNVTSHTGDGRLGLPDEAPFGGILIWASGTRVPDELVTQLKVDSHLVAFIGQDKRRQQLVRLTRKDDNKFFHEVLGEVPMTTELSEILVELGTLDRVVVERVQARAKAEDKSFEELLPVETSLAETDLVLARAVKFGLKYANVDNLRLMADRSVIQAVSEAFIHRTKQMPLVLNLTTLVVATTDPRASIDEVNQVFRASKVDLYLVSETDFRRLWSSFELDRIKTTYTGLEGISADTMLSLSDDRGKDKDSRGRMIEVLEALLLEAIGERASDIHLERSQDEAQVRLRVDGALRVLEGFELRASEMAGLLNVLKINANMDIAETRRPQGGRFSRRVGGVDYTLRVETQPSLHGEHAVLRMLRQHTQVLSIKQLGFPKKIADQYTRLLNSPGGLILVVGPTGSGKTTTLYAGIQRLAEDSQRKVITVEDPIEYSFRGIQQTQSNAAVGFTFATAMRHLVRQDPDVIVLGEIRDADTALETIRASQTGHLVLSTLHSNQAVGAVQRLRDLGMHPNSIASELLAIVAQRLARRICDGCRVVDYNTPAWILEELFPDGPPKDFVAHVGRGCARCGGHGTFGRIAVVEFMSTTLAVRQAIARQASLDELRATAARSGLMSMRDSAIEHVKAGLIPLTEVPRVIGKEWMKPTSPTTPV